jgi:hypothetical protein
MSRRKLQQVRPDALERVKRFIAGHRGETLEDKQVAETCARYGYKLRRGDMDRGRMGISTAEGRLRAGLVRSSAMASLYPDPGRLSKAPTGGKRSLASNLPNSLASNLPSSLSSILPNNLRSILASILPSSLRGIVPNSLDGIVPSSAGGILPSSLTSILPNSLSSILPNSSRSILPNSFGGILPNSLPSNPGSGRGG